MCFVFVSSCNWRGFVFKALHVVQSINLSLSIKYLKWKILNNFIGKSLSEKCIALLTCNYKCTCITLFYTETTNWNASFKIWTFYLHSNFNAIYLFFNICNIKFLYWLLIKKINWKVTLILKFGIFWRYILFLFKHFHSILMWVFLWIEVLGALGCIWTNFSIILLFLRLDPDQKRSKGPIFNFFGIFILHWILAVFLQNVHLYYF